VYVVLAASGAPGVSVAVRLPALYVTLPLTAVPAASRSRNVVALIVTASIAWLNVAFTLVPALTPVAPAPGVVPVTVGAAGGAAVGHDQT
jgi:hypothetical protein